MPQHTGWLNHHPANTALIIDVQRRHVTFSSSDLLIHHRGFCVFSCSLLSTHSMTHLNTGNFSNSCLFILYSLWLLTGSLKIWHTEFLISRHIVQVLAKFWQKQKLPKKGYNLRFIAMQYSFHYNYPLHVSNLQCTNYWFFLFVFLKKAINKHRRLILSIKHEHSTRMDGILNTHVYTDENNNLYICKLKKN